MRVLLAHRAQRGRRGEEGGDLVFLDHAPEGAGVGRADRLALVEDRRAAVQQRRVDDVGMADHPADVGSRPIGLARLDAVDRAHRPFQRDAIAAGVAHDALGRSGRAGGVEDVERVGGGEFDAGRAFARRARRGDQRRPVVVALGEHLAFELRPLEDDAGLRLVPGEADRQIEQRLVFDQAAGLDAAARRQHQLGLGVVDAGRQLLGGEAAEHHRMDRADARAGEHGEQRLGDHRHVDDDAVALADAEIDERRGERRHLVLQLAIADAPLRMGDRAVVIDRRLVAAAGGDMAVDGVEAGVQRRVGKPAAVDAGLRVEDRLRRADPVDPLGRLGPESKRIGAPLRVDFAVAAAHRFAPARRAAAIVVFAQDLDAPAGRAQSASR